MNATFYLVLGVLLLGIVIVITPLIVFAYLYTVDRKQKEHSVLRNYPLLGRVRYILEKIGPELRQYLFDHDNTGKPFSRVDYENIVLPAKYWQEVVSFGSKRDFEAAGYYIKNAMFPKQQDEMNVDNRTEITTKRYIIDEDNLFTRKEHIEQVTVKPWLLPDSDAVVIGENCREPFVVKGLVGMSGMSYGSLGDRAITALSNGLGMAGGTWMNTGEGGISPYHLKGNVDIVMQIGPGLFGVRDREGNFSWEALRKKSEIEQVKAFELKLAQGAKTRGGHVEGDKVSPEIAAIRNVEPYKTIDSPNRFNEFHDIPSMVDFMEEIRAFTGKPVGMKIVVGGPDAVDELAAYMGETGKGPDFITVDGGEGGTGASFQELADSVGLPIKSALVIVDDTLRKYGVRDRVKLIASGKLFTPDRIAVALALGADLVNIARAFMITVGCIQAQICHTNNCPVGVATTDPQLQEALIVDEKQYRVLNYVVRMREGLYMLAAAAGIDSPRKFSREHVIYRDSRGRVFTLADPEGIGQMSLDDVSRVS